MRSKNNKEQVVVVAEFKSARYIGIEIPLLRQREVASIVEVICMSELKYLTNGKFNSVYFTHHIGNALSRKYSYLGLSNAYLVRYAMSGGSN